MGIFFQSTGSKDQDNRVSGPNCYNIDGIWAFKLYHLGPWTLRAMSGAPPGDRGALDTR